MAQGQAVGTAALAVTRGVTPRGVPIRDLRATLFAQGAEVRQSLGAPSWRAIAEVGQFPTHRPLPGAAGVASVEPPRPAGPPRLRLSGPRPAAAPPQVPAERRLR